jgi:hypothetical protein
MYLLSVYQGFSGRTGQFQDRETNRKSGFRGNKFTIIMRMKRKEFTHAVEAGTF